MKIKEIILEGFKSYRNRIELSSLDPQFNCITGLNGSGKSNILDAICFVLGLKSLSHVRASSFTDLIYKGGNSGVKEASVTVVFDNTDKSKSPEGYADTDTIMVVRKISRGKTRFYVNGTGMNNLNVKRMFKSVGLNIDNPETFFVQQGRITKIVNFRPSELLEMLEEAAGIGFYKEIAKDCEEVVSEKSNRLELQEDRMNSFLGTKLKILDKEAQRVQEHEQAVEELTLQEALVWNLDVYNSRKAVYFGNKAIESTKEAVNAQEKEKAALIQELQRLKELPSNSAEAAQIVKRRTSEISNIKNKVTEMQKNYRNSELYKNSDKDKKHTLETRVSRLHRELQELEFKNNERGVEMDELQQRLRTAREEQASLAERIADVERTEDFQNLNSLAREKKEVDRKIETLNSEISKREWDKEHHEKELNGFLREQVDIDSHRQKIENELNLVIKEAQQLRETHSRDQTRNEVYELDKALRKINDQETEFQTFCNYNEIRPRDFEVDFDKRKVSEQVVNKVCGYAYKLFKVKEGLAKAIEAGSGGSLYNVVVEDDKVSKELLINRCFDRKVTFLPLNTIRPRSIRADRLAMAKEIAKKYQSNLYYPASDEDCPAIDPKYKIVRDFVLGGYVICDNVEAANKIAYTPGCELVVVTTDGDVFDPSGLINGGYNHVARASQFVKWLRYSKIKEEVSSNHREKQRLLELRRNLDNNLQVYTNNARKLEGLEDRIGQLKKRYKDFDENNIAAMLENRKMQFEKSKRFLQAYKEDLAALLKEKLELDARTSDYQEVQSKELMLKGLKERHTQVSTKVKSLSKDYYQLEAERNDDTKEISKKKESLVLLQQQLARTEEDAIQKEKDTKNLAQQIEQIEKELEEKQEALRTLLASERDWKEKQGKADVRLQQLEASITQAKSSIFKQEAALASAKIRWVDLQAQATSKGLTILHGKEVSGLFNPLHEGQGSFEGWSEWVDDKMERYNSEEELNKYKKLKERVEEGASRVNLQATQHKDQLRDRMALLENQKEELASNRKQIDNNKRHLDSKSVAAVLDCFQKVSAGFGTIFRGFLAGADAKMEPIYTNSVLTGIEIKVSFNGVWKSSLGELSGGQRSLLALSFLLSLLQYKASPFYILDEVDAAMDLAHTENIGNVISRHFPQSQFLVISLKEAMHQQARVVYRTTVTDGQSKVVRYTQKVN